MKKQIIILICCMGFLVSCEDFLTRYPEMSLADQQAVVDLTTADNALRGMYDYMQNEFGYGRGILVIADAPTENNILSPQNSNRYTAVAQWTTTASTTEPASIWLRCYRSINAANKILANIDIVAQSLGATQPQVDAIEGEALAMRALMHFELVRLYAQAYPGNESAMGVPYSKVSITLEKPSRDNVKTVYDNIIADLKEATTLLTPENSSGNAPYRLDHWAAKAILARVYMAQLDYANAKPILSDIITNSGYKLMANTDYTGAWAKKYNSVSKTEFMFAISSWDNTDYGATTSLGYIYLAPEKGGYGDLRVPKQMYDLYSEGDIRKSAFFYQGTGTAADWIFVNKYPSRDGFNGLSDNPVMRLSDVYLMYAEACAYTNDEVAAVEYLDMIRMRAEPDAAVSTETGDALKDKIFLEIRKEFAYEGHYLHDLKRYHKTINSAYNGAGIMYTTITYPDNRLAFAIPQTEKDANPNMEQNPGY